MKKKVVIIGGGFAGSSIAKCLEKDFEVVLIDSKGYFEFTPGVLRTIVEPEHMDKIQALHHNYLKYAEIVVVKVKEVKRNSVLVGKKRIDFDYLVVSSGSSYNAPFKEQNAVMATRASHLKKYYKHLLEAKKVLIVGGGLVGIEMTGEILWKYGEEKKITLVHAGEKLMSRGNERAIKLCEKFLNRKNVEIVYGESVDESRDGVYFTNKGREIETDIAFFCTGIIPNYDFMMENFSSFLNRNRQVEVNEFLQMHGSKNIFAAGDVAGIDEEKTAQNAERQGKVVAGNIVALEKGGELIKYESKKTPMVISLGKWRGIFTFGNFAISGVIPALMKRFIEKREMWKRR